MFVFWAPQTPQKKKKKKKKQGLGAGENAKAALLRAGMGEMRDFASSVVDSRLGAGGASGSTVRAETFLEAAVRDGKRERERERERALCFSFFVLFSIESLLRGTLLALGKAKTEKKEGSENERRRGL